MSRERDSTAAPLETGPALTVRESQLTWEHRCEQCGPPWLARCADPFEPKLREVLRQHNEQTGHSSTLEPINRAPAAPVLPHAVALAGLGKAYAAAARAEQEAVRAAVVSERPDEPPAPTPQTAADRLALLRSGRVLR